MNKLIDLKQLSSESKKILEEARPYLGDITNPKLQDLYYEWCKETNNKYAVSEDVEENLNRFYVASKQWTGKKNYDSKKQDFQNNIRSELLQYRQKVMKGF